MLLIIAKRNDEIQRFVFPFKHPDQIPVVCAHANQQLADKGWTILFRMFPFVDCGRSVVYDVDSDGNWGAGPLPQMVTHT